MYFFAASTNLVVHNWISRTTGTELLSNGVTLRNFEFIMVTDKPSIIQGFQTLYAPFDMITWQFFLYSFLALAFMMQLLSPKKQCYPRAIVASLGNKIFWILSNLLGQSDGILLIASRKTSILFPLLQCWYLGCMFLGNFYQGEVYSTLTAQQIPSLPRTMVELINSKFKILTLSSVNVSLNRNSIALMSSLQYHLKLMLDASEESSRSTLYLGALMKQITHLFMCESHGKCQSDSSFLYDSNGTAVNTKGTIAFMDFMERTEQIVNLMGISNTKLVLGNQEDVNLRMAVLTGIRNYVLPFINFASGQLHSSGLLERWKLLGNFRALYYDVGILFGTYNSEYFRRRRVNAKGPVVFNESKPVSVKVIENLVMVFGTLLFLGAVAFAVKQQGIERDGDD
ncbi:hypothetical protein Fcan01_24291 [Folsomia candida]|uniref:Uncharacterized protein n=1 Tax=Folsomia candida TaxID=158441 RepID=A0A226D765_FOLCA|nr:hypothetical protein Fcan01_24291 [Folsomia candida]